MDKVIIDSLRIEAQIGIFDWEQAIHQPLELTLEMDWDVRKAAVTGKIEEALDYAAVAQSIQKHVQAQSWGLIEEVAESVATLILSDFNVPQVTLTVKKPTAVALAAFAAVTITRTAS